MAVRKAMLSLPYRSTIPIILMLLLSNFLYIILITAVNLSSGILMDLSLFILIRSGKSLRVCTKAITLLF
jgi:hypothetical protein